MRAVEAVAILLMSGTAMLVAQDTGTWTNGTNTGTAARIISDEQIRDLIRRGEVCRVRNAHVWATSTLTTLEYRPEGGYSERRTCALCGKTETKQPGEWK
jgi:hypothetical protein